jgi:hypothetical protein
VKKQSVRKLTLALTLLASTAPFVHASTTPPPPPPPPAPQSVTGTDPVPTSPNVIEVILAILHLA